MAETEYDVVAYPGRAFPQAHPERLAVIGKLFGMSPVPVTKCRVLEIGCSEGNHLIPLAYNYPDSEFLGVDLAVTAVSVGQKTIAELGLKNIELRAEDLLEFPASAGKFDYIVTHGIYSWVPQIVRDKIMAVCRDHLSPNGIAYISYNAMPGGHVRAIFRDMMRFHTRAVTDPAAKIAKARACIRFVASGMTNSDDPLSKLMRDEVDRHLLDKDEGVLYHDDLADINQPYYFHEFMSHANQHGLNFLGEADYFELSARNFPPETAEVLSRMQKDDPLLREQYMDFMKCRRFRQTLLVRQDAPFSDVRVARQIRTLAAASAIKPVSISPDLSVDVEAKFKNPKGGMITLRQPLAKAAFLHLGSAYPRAVPFAELVSAARQILGPIATTPADEDDLAEILHEAYSVDLIDLQSGPATFTMTPWERPTTSAVARLQLQTVDDDLVTNLRHAQIRVEPGLSRKLIELLDGTRNRADVIEALADWAIAHPPAEGEPPTRAAWQQRFAAEIDRGIAGVASMALLVN